MKLRHNVKIAQLCSNVPHQTPDWNSLFKKIQERGMLEKGKRFDIGTIGGFALEEHVKNCLESRTQIRDLDFPVTLGDIPIDLNGKKRFDCKHGDQAEKRQK